MSNGRLMTCFHSLMIQEKLNTSKLTLEILKSPLPFP